MRQPIAIEQLTLDFQGDVAVLTISSFGQDLTKDMAAKVAQIQDRDIDNVVLDVRSNGGGLLDEAIAVSSFFIDEGETVLREESNDGTRVYEARDKGALFGEDVDVVVLQNRFSASASEIVAGALRDQRGATIVGEKSFGKGVVQSVYNLPEGGVLKLTVAEWFTPDGEAINEVGLIPDVAVEGEQDPLEVALDQFSN